MSGDIHVKGGGTTTTAAVRSDFAATGKFTSILKYLDHVSAGNNTLLWQQHGTDDERTEAIPRVVITDRFDDESSPSSSSSTPSSGLHEQWYHHQGGRRRRPRHDQSSSKPPMSGDGDESKLARGGVRAAWDNSTKGYDKAAKTSSSTRNSAYSSHGDLSPPSGRRRSRPEVAVVGQRSQPSTTDQTGRDRDRRARSNTAARDSPSSRPHPDVVNRRYSAAVGRELSPLPGADNTADDGWKRGGSEDTLDYSSSTAGTEAPTATVGGKAQQQQWPQQRQRQRRWVWDEWDGKAGRSPSPPSLHRGSTNPTTITTTSSGSRSILGRHTNNRRTRSSNGPHAGSSAAGTTRTSRTTSADAPRPPLNPPRPPPGEVVETNYAAAERKHGSRTWSPPSKRENNDISAGAVRVDDDGAACTPAARRAFEDVQATARSMKANLKEKRSEVGSTNRCARYLRVICSYNSRYCRESVCNRNTYSLLGFSVQHNKNEREAANREK